MCMPIKIKLGIKPRKPKLVGIFIFNEKTKGYKFEQRFDEFETVENIEDLK